MLIPTLFKRKFNEINDRLSGAADPTAAAAAAAAANNATASNGSTTTNGDDALTGATPAPALPESALRRAASEHALKL